MFEFDISSCGGYKTDEPRCDLLAHLEDPFTNKCTPSCDSECVDGVCDFCFCSTKNITTTVTPTLTQECKRIRNPIDCTIDNCAFEELHSCNNQQFMVNPFHRFECVLRCDAVGTNCPNGWCSALGHCTCHLGYRPDVTNPRVCVKIPGSNTTEVEKVCYKGFKLDSKGDCVSKCGECKNGCCDANGVCRCRSGYKFNPKTSSCVFVNKPKETPKEMACSDRCLNGMCDADNVCQCMDCEALTTTSPDCEISQDTTVAMISRICENSTSSDDMVSKATHNT